MATAAPAYIPQTDPYSIPAGFKTTTTPQGGTAYQDTTGNLYTRDAGGFKLQTSLPGPQPTQTTTTGQTPASPAGVTTTTVAPQAAPQVNVAPGSGYTPPPPAGTPAAPAPTAPNPWNVTQIPGNPNATPEMLAQYNTALDALHGVTTPAAPAAATPGTTAPAAAQPPAPVVPPQPPQTASNPTNTLAALPDLAPGSSGDAVKQLQQYLIAQGFNIKDGATGYYGDETKAAVTAWQNANKIDTQGNPGYFGPISKQFITSSGAQSQGSGTTPNANGTAGTTGTSGTSTGNVTADGMHTDISASDYYKKPDETIDQYNARIAALRGDTSTPQGQAMTSLSDNGSKVTPQDFATDPVGATVKSYNDVYTSLGLAPVKTEIDDTLSQMTDIDKNLQDKIMSINEDPWISEALRSKMITAETSKSNALKADLAKVLSLYQSVYDKGVQQAQFIVTTAVGVLKQQQSFDQQQTMQAIKTADTIATNNAKGADLTSLEKDYLFAVKNDGFSGSLLDFKNEYDASSSSNPKSTVKKFQTDLTKGIPKGMTREQFIRLLQQRYPDINGDDITQKVYETYPDNYETGKAPASGKPWWQFY